MTRSNIATFGCAAMALGLASAAMAAQSITSMGYVDGLQRQINHAADTGAINNYQRNQLLQLQQRTHNIAWRCDSTGDQSACQRAAQNVDYINQMIGRTGYDNGPRYNRGYGYWNSSGYYHRPYDGGGYQVGVPNP